MKKEIKRISVVQAMKVSGVLYALLGFVFAIMYLPFIGIYLAMLKSALQDDAGFLPAAGGIGVTIGMLILFPIMYGFFGAIFGAISSLLYNLVVKWVGGYHIEVADVATYSDYEIAE